MTVAGGAQFSGVLLVFLVMFFFGIFQAPFFRATTFSLGFSVTSPTNNVAFLVLLGCFLDIVEIDTQISPLEVCQLWHLHSPKLIVCP